MVSARFALALERLGPGDWAEFEKFASEFLAPEYPSLRTTAAPYGDRGRDGQMYIPDEAPTEVVQYSVTVAWDQKIKETLDRLAATMPEVRRLVYATNQAIGPKADELVQAARMDRGVSVDVRDCSWFVDRELTYPQRAVAAAELAERFVDPLLRERGVRDLVAPALDAGDARLALLHLALETEDEASDKGLTKRAFEALVLSALHDTSADARVTVSALTERVIALLPGGHDRQISELIEGALNRLSRRGGPVKHISQTDEYHLAYDEQLRLRERLERFLEEDQRLGHELVEVVRVAVPELPIDEQYEQLAADLRFGLETVLLKRGEGFAAAATAGEVHQVNAREILDVITAAGRTTGRLLTDEQATTAVLAILERPSEALKDHLRRLADAYTMYAFLRATPDVQRVVVSLFTGGEIWLDTTVVLPLFAEELIDAIGDRHYSTLFRAARDAGLKLYVTEGVAEEIERHLNLGLTFARTETQEWRTRVPFVYAAYALAGRPRREFVSWLENFRGGMRPLDDIVEYLSETHGIALRPLTEEAERASTDLRGAVQEIWLKVHESRAARTDSDSDIQTMHRLVAHDVENCVGVIELRRTGTVAPMGYRYWYLTLDRTAMRLGDHLRDRLGSAAPVCPALSPDFMAQYLRLSPVRTAIDRSDWANLPLLTDISRYEFMPKELIDLADQLRADSAGLEDRAARRRVRDRMDRERLRFGPEALRGVRGAEDRVFERLREQSKKSAPSR